MSEQNIEQSPEVKQEYDQQLNKQDDVNQNGSYDHNQFGSLDQQQNKKRTHRKSDISTFIMKTYKILDEKKNSDIVQWSDEGNCFIVKNKQRFQSEILPKYFKHRKFSSFVRQLNMYDFHKIRKQKQIPIFKHKYFKRGGQDLLHKIKRKSAEQGPKEDEQKSLQQTPMNDISKKQQSVIRSSINIISDIEMITKQNAELQHNLAQLSHQINYLEMSKNRKKEKLMKILSGMMFFELKEKINPEINSLRKLQDHFIKDQQPWSFMTYSDHLSSIYSYIKSTIQ